MDENRRKGGENGKKRENGAMFANFAELEPDDDIFCKWASGHGRLIKAEDVGNAEHLWVLPDKQTLRLAESKNFWYKEHAELAYATKMWDSWETRDKESLGEMLRWFRKNTSMELLRLGRRETFFGPKLIRPWAAKLFRFPDILGPAKLCVEETVNQKLIEYPLRLELIRNEKGDIKKCLRPSSLLSAMWYQLYLVLNGEIKLKRCASCCKWEDMKNHRSNWTKHKNCAIRERVRKCRDKQKVDNPVATGPES